MKKYNLPVENMKMSLYSKLACEALACNALGNMSGNLVFILYCFKQEKLSALSLRIQQIETLLNILDAKLSSVPGLEDEISNTSVMNGSASQTLVEPQTTNISPNVETSVPELGQQKTNGTDVITVAKDPHYARYLKMVQVGVPVMAIRNKMISEGLNPDLLETPDAPVPAWGDETNKGESSDSESSFSD
ncbi:PREDICTED: WASH complex subunit CCDC53 isoform X2 [Thamnophis sirtalis]|uniref:WASH complex subunit 3 n=1 Tax=Thamnophis sirtalis TaxID=35019 RepID=A0A6I9Y6W5_9SAUR|nr:PREDICTED: WASH complex subunit CCDC53 isoform X2 [Thamnophis sirtalis]